MIAAAEPDPPRAGLSRRKLFGAAGVTAAVVGAAGVRVRSRPGVAVQHRLWRAAPTDFVRGERQAAFITPQQDRMHFCTDDRDDVIALLRQWTKMADRMTRAISWGGATEGNP